MDNKTFFDQTIDDFFNSQEDNLIYYYIPEEETDIINSIKKNMISYRDYNFRRYNNELDILKYGDKYAVREFYNYYGVAIEVFNLPRHNPYGNDIIKHYRAFLNALGVYIKYNGKEGFLDRHFC